MAKKPSASTALAARFAADCLAAGFRIISAKGSVVTCQATFPAGDHHAYCIKDSAAGTLMLSLKTTASGSLWGSTSDGVGGAVALNRGVYTINRSGVSERLVAAIAKTLQPA